VGKKPLDPGGHALKGLGVKGEVGVAQINEKFQLHRIITKFGVPGVLMKAIKSCKLQLDPGGTLGVKGVSKNPVVHFIIQFPL
jgi:hypothetical protein